MTWLVFEYITPPTLKLKFGMQPPAGVKIAWGARAIYSLERLCNSGDLGIDILFDRQDIQGGTEEDRFRLVEVVNTTLLPDLRRECRSRYVEPFSVETVVVETVVGEHESYKLVASPLRSYGYLYIGAWKVPSPTVETTVTGRVLHVFEICCTGSGVKPCVDAERGCTQTTPCQGCLFCKLAKSGKCPEVFEIEDKPPRVGSTDALGG
jgi:hypothetical protein